MFEVAMSAPRITHTELQLEGREARIGDRRQSRHKVNGTFGYHCQARPPGTAGQLRDRCRTLYQKIEERGRAAKQDVGEMDARQQE
jgi:hypothetical protein